MAFDIAYKKSVEKDLANLGKAEARRILDKIEKDLATRADAYHEPETRRVCPSKPGKITSKRSLELRNQQRPEAMKQEG